MFNKILLAVDGSEGSRKAIPAVIDLATKSHSEVLVIQVGEYHVVELQDPVDRGSAQAATGAIADELKQAGVNARSLVFMGGSAGVARGIVQSAEEFGADCIAMGSRGAGNLGGLLIGSVANKVVQLASCPVLVVR
jgi:nucleotide-binding universal stress UspA family protein